MSTGPILSSIGTVLIDVFESLPNSTNVSLPVPPTPVEPSTSPSTSTSSSFEAPIWTDTPETGPYELIGGGGLYAIAGARLWLPPRDLRILVDRSLDESDFPVEMEKTLSRYGEEMWVYNRGPNTRIPRTKIGYSGNTRSFEYTVHPPKRTISAIRGTPLDHSTYLHVVAAPSDVATLDAEMTDWHPKIILEPHSLYCTPNERNWLESIVGFVQVLSPNHEELMSIFSIPVTELDDRSTRPTVERLIRYLLSLGVGRDGQGIVVVRCGRLGSCVGTSRRGLHWVPAYFRGPEQVRVKDVTGAGNAFLGGFAAGLALNGDPYEAALYATVSASFIVEQSGLPSLDFVDGKELWNNETPMSRIEELRRVMREDRSFSEYRPEEGS